MLATKVRTDCAGALRLPASRQGTRPNPKIHGISYHGPAGWANDWVDNWTSTNSYPYWILKVIKAGEHEVQLKYARQSRHRQPTSVEVGGESLTTKIANSFSGPMLPSADHYSSGVHERGGHNHRRRCSIKKGLTQLKVRVLEIPGSEA